MKKTKRLPTAYEAQLMYESIMHRLTNTTTQQDVIDLSVIPLGATVVATSDSALVKRGIPVVVKGRSGNRIYVNGCWDNEDLYAIA